ncbi:MAG: glycosyltransferase family 4 protein [Holophaga sp.]|nr:glycosyltransferase family 4 protein [Holophaga sp.]
MRLVILHRGFMARGGAETLALAQAQDLAAAGLDVQVVTFSFDPLHWKGALEDIPVHLVPRHHWTDLPFALDRNALLRHRTRRVASLLRRLAPDIVLAHNHPSPAMLGACNVDARKLWFCHEPPRGLYPRQTSRFLAEAGAKGLLAGHPELARGLDRHLARERENKWDWRRGVEFDQAGIANLDGIAANSSYTRASVAAAYGGRQAEVHYPMVPMEPLPHRSGINRDGLQVLVQTRLELMKNVDTVIRGFRLARPHLGSQARLHVVGKGEALESLHALVKELELGDAVTFHGFVSDAELKAMRQSCDAFALVPWDEPFGMVYPEAAAAGLLMIGPDHGGPEEILGGGRYGWCVPPQAPVALAEALCTVFRTSDAEADQMRLRALNACQARFAPDVVLPRFRKWVTG